MISNQKTKARILVIDDERIVAEDVTECLQSLGCDVVGTALSGPDAIRLAGELRPDLIMMDIVLQGDMDGTEAAMVIRKQFDISCVFLTAYSDSTVLDRAKLTNPAGFIVKPFEENTLRATVEIALFKVRAEQQLRQNRELLSTTLSNLADSVIATNAQGMVTFLNPQAERFLGIQSAEGLNQHFSTVCPLLDSSGSEIIYDFIPAVIEKGGVAAGECLFSIRHQDHLRLVDPTVSVIHEPTSNSAQATLAGLVITLHDVTKSRKNEAELIRHREHLEELVAGRTAELIERNKQLQKEIAVRKSTENALAYQAKLQNLFSTISSGLLQIRAEDDGTNITQSLKQIAEFFQIDAVLLHAPLHRQIASSFPDAQKNALTWPPEMGHNVNALQSEIDISWLTRPLADQPCLLLSDTQSLQDRSEARWLGELGIQSALIFGLSKSDPDQGIFILCSFGPARQWYQEDLKCIRLCINSIYNTLLHFKGEAERTVLQEQLTQSQKMEAIGKLSGGIAHDFNNMLLPIMGYADMLIDTMEQGDVRTADLAEIRKAAERAATLTRQLLAFSRKQVIAKSVFHPNSCITGMENMLRRLIGEDTRFHVIPTEGIYNIRADLGQMEQIIMNLVVNARDAIEPGGNITVTTSMTDITDSRIGANPRHDASQKFVVIEVSDDGCGMPDDVRRKIFDPFFTTKGLDGTGLGLSVVFGIVEQHNGYLHVRSAPGEGSTFSIILPAHSPVISSGMDSEASKNGARARAANQGNGEKILLVEDEIGVARFVSHALKQSGYDVETAGTLTEAQALFRNPEKQYEMVFSDAVLPDGNGIELLDEVLATNPEIRTLLSSGYTDKHQVLRMLADRSITFLQKPYSLPVLIETVRKVLEGDADVPIILNS